MKLPRFKIGDKLKASDYHKRNHAIEFVTITLINNENKVYHWEANFGDMAIKMHSGYYFKEAVKYEKTKRRPWNYGKRKPVADDCGVKWCNCVTPKLTSNSGGRGQAFCLLCMEYWYH